MATANPTGVATTISSEAIRLMDCVESGYEDVIYALAEGFAVRRAAGGEVEIMADDVQSAANLLASILSTSSELPADVKPVVEGMRDCMSRKLAHR